MPPAVERQARRPALRDDRGAAAVELALVLPLLLVLIFGVIDFGRMLNIQLTLSEAAREGARVVALRLDDSDVTERIDSARNGITLSGEPEIVPCSLGALDEAAQVTLSHNFEPITPLDAFLGLVSGSDSDTAITLTGEGEMPCVG